MIERNDILICLEKVTRMYKNDRLAVSACDITVDTENLAVIGEDGAGKTTLAKLICGTLLPTSGSVTVDGFSADSKEAAGSVGYISEKCPLEPSLSVHESLKYYCELRGIDPSFAEAAEDEIGLSYLERRLPVGRLSDISQRRASIAFAVLGKPKYLLLDQPLGGLEPEDENNIKKVLSELAKKYILIYFTDSPADAAEFCDLALVLSLGRTVGYGKFSELGTDDGEPCSYKARVKGDGSKLKEALDAEVRVRKHSASVSASGAIVLEITMDRSIGAAAVLSALFTRTGCSVIELKKTDSPLERVMNRLYASDEDKKEKRRERELQKAPPIKLDASFTAFRHDDD